MGPIRLEPGDVPLGDGRLRGGGWRVGARDDGREDVVGAHLRREDVQLALVLLLGGLEHERGLSQGLHLVERLLRFLEQPALQRAFVPLQSPQSASEESISQKHSSYFATDPSADTCNIACTQ